MRELTQYWSQYPKLGLLAGSACAALCATLLLAPSVIHLLFQIDSPSSTDVMSGRAAMLFLGLSIIALQSRNAEPSPLRASISLGLGVSMAGLFCIGILDLLRGAVGWGILLALLAEAFFATAYLRFWRVR